MKQKVLEDEFDISMTEEMKGEFHGMGGIGDMIEREALAKKRIVRKALSRAMQRVLGYYGKYDEQHP